MCEVLSTAESLCPVCMHRLPAEVVARNRRFGVK
jgi:uncharacterized radical SAM superfamily Fe-S cluster-containing enzyme